MRESVVEILVLGIAAGAAGVALAFGLLRLLVKMFPDRSPVTQLDRVSINPLALAVTVGLVLIATLLCAIPACAGLGRTDLTKGLNAASRTASSNRGANRMRYALVAFEVALSLLLLVGSALMLRT